MANRRMFARSVVQAARFLRMSLTTQALYFHLGLEADDEGVVDAFKVLRMVGAAEDDLRVLVAKGLIQILDDDEMVAYITDWATNNQIRKDRFQPSVHHDLLVQIVDLPEPEPLPADIDEPEPEQTIMDLGPVQNAPEQVKPKREYRGKSWGTEKPEITEEARAEAAHLAEALDSRTPLAPPTSAQKKAAYSRAIQEVLNNGYKMDAIRGTLDWLVSDAYGTEYYRGRILSDAAVLRNEFKPMYDRAVSSYDRALKRAQAGRYAS